MLFWHTFLSWNHFMVLVISLVANFCLALCIYVEKNTHIRHYRLVLIMQCFADIFATISLYLLSPRCVMIDGNLVTIFTGFWSKFDTVFLFGRSVEIKYIIFILYPLGVLAALLCIPLNFRSRYALICR